ncbi:MAG: DUF3817 domain-containing protein [Flavobacteriaceae bacterium]|nr:MAG: DUF3817 domain-containing protein [Flavobacteriaceae bacterium]
MISSLLQSDIGKFRIVAFLEGISYLSLAITMYYKYVHAIGLPNKIVGMFHGILFIIYVVLAFRLRKKYDWSFSKFAIILIASLIPFGTFYIDYKYLRIDYTKL